MLHNQMVYGRHLGLLKFSGGCSKITLKLVSILLLPTTFAYIAETTLMAYTNSVKCIMRSS